MTVANAKPDQLIRGPLGTTTVNAASSAWWDVSTVEAKISEAIAYAVSIGAKAVYVPDCFLPYTASLVTFNTGVQMIREGGSPSLFDIDAYGARGDGVTDDTLSIQAAILAAAPPAATGPITCSPGKTYAVGVGYQGLNTAADAAKLLSIAQDNAYLNFTGATLKYGGAVNITNGNDNNGLAVMNVLANNVTFIGTIDCNNKAKFAIGIFDIKKGMRWDATFTNVLEPGAWSGLIYALSSDMTGQAPSTRSKNNAGWLKRPSCPFANQSDVISQHHDITALIYGGDGLSGNNTGGAIVGGNTTAVNGFVSCRIDNTGVPLFGFPGDANAHLLDALVGDLGASAFELYGPFLPVPQRPAWAASITPQVGGSNVPGSSIFLITATSNIAATIAAPTGSAGIDRCQPLKFILFNNSGGALTTPIAFATGAGAFKASGGVSPANGSRITVEFTYDFSANLWVESYRGAAV